MKIQLLITIAAPIVLALLIGFWGHGILANSDAQSAPTPTGSEAAYGKELKKSEALGFLNNGDIHAAISK